MENIIKKDFESHYSYGYMDVFSSRILVPQIDYIEN